MMNGRPLTQGFNNFRDVDPITPNHFLLGRASPNCPPGNFLDMSVTIASNRKRARQLSDQIGNHFPKEYKPTHLKRGNWSTSTPNLAT